jgi:hypothetical protein
MKPTSFTGKMIPFSAILSGKVSPPAGTGAFLTAVRKYARQSAKDQGSLGHFFFAERNRRGSLNENSRTPAVLRFYAPGQI